MYSKYLIRFAESSPQPVPPAAQISFCNYLFFFPFFSKQPSLPHVAQCRLPKCISSDLSRYTGENMCSRTSARRDRRSAMMFHYIDYADTAVRTRNRQRAGWGGGGGQGEREKGNTRKRAGRDGESGGDKQTQTEREERDGREHREMEQV